MRKNFLIVFSLLLSLVMVTSCSESDGEEYEFENWQSRNESYYNDVYTMAKNAVAAGSGEWKVIRNWSLDEMMGAKPENNIVVRVLESGTGTGCPMYTDSVQVHYIGRLMPSATYTEGLVFDRSYAGTFNPNTAKPVKFAVRDLVDGFTTALQNMHIGDYWRVYIPSDLGYGESGSSSVPGYSVLVFDIYLAAYYRAGVTVPEWKSKTGVWFDY